MNPKYFFIGNIIIIVLFLTLAVTGNQLAYGLNNDRPVLSAPNQSIPTRTPTPGPQPPTNTPGPKPTKSDNGGDQPTAVPTSTSQIIATNTAAPLVTIAYTPVGGFIPTAESCSSQPTIQVQNPANVRSGPGINYSIVDKLVYLEVRFITGRAADTAWWQIQLKDGTNGWITDNIVTVQGYIGSVPVVPAPAINGKTPTPGPLWNPTPRPECPVPPTATATAVTPTFTPSPTVEEPTAASDDTTAVEATAVTESTNTTDDTQPAAESAESALPTDTPIPLPTQTAVAPPTLMPTTALDQPEAISAEQEVAALAAVPLETTPASSAVDWLLPVAGLLLIAGGAVSFVNRRKKQ